VVERAKVLFEVWSLKGHDLTRCGLCRRVTHVMPNLALGIEQRHIISPGQNEMPMRGEDRLLSVLGTRCDDGGASSADTGHTHPLAPTVGQE